MRGCVPEMKSEWKATSFLFIVIVGILSLVSHNANAAESMEAEVNTGKGYQSIYTKKVYSSKLSTVLNQPSSIVVLNDVLESDIQAMEDSEQDRGMDMVGIMNSLENSISCWV